MEEKFIPRLTGGTFFYLLANAKRKGYSKAQNLAGKKDGMGETNMLIDLMHIASPNYFVPAPSTLKNNTSLFKSCELDHTQWLCFDDPNFIQEFDLELKTNYEKILKRADTFVQKYIEVEREFIYKKIGQMLIGLIKSDESIDEDDFFYIDSGINPTAKKDISTTVKYSFQGLILGIWHYIVCNQIKNSEGKETISNWKIYDSKKMSSNPKSLHSLAIAGTGYLIYTFLSTDLRLQPEFSQINAPTPDDVKTNYLTKIKNKYKALKTLFYTESPQEFYNFYVCNDLTYKGRFISSKESFLFYYDDDSGPSSKDSTAIKLLKTFTNFVLITGTGGLGKSMMMRHLLLNAIEEYPKYKLLPLFITLKDYDASCDILEFIYNNIKGSFNISITQLKSILANGEALILLDGLDEIKTDYLASFEKALEQFTDKFSSNMFVMSSRPFQSFVSFSRFHEFRLKPFSKKQALELITKLQFRPDEPQIKEKFIKLLDEELYYSHKEFAENPLLLTIMLMTFEQYAEVPKKMHIFYREAYLTLSQKHDAVKGAYKITLKTGLTSERFMEYLAEFCCRTYRDEKFEFTYQEGEAYFKNLKEHERYPNENISYSDFINDLRHGMCLLYYESQKFHFTHRSFQEYFCALFFSRQKDKHLGNIGTFFENKKTRAHGDKTFSMLHDMIPDKIEEYIFLPYLRNLINECEKEDGYFTFLKKIFPVIEYTAGETNDSSYNLSSSYLYSFISIEYSFAEDRCITDLPIYDEFVINECVTIQLQNGDYECVSLNDLNGDEDDKPEPEGWYSEFSIEDVLNDKEYYKDLIEALNNEEFPLKKEYESLKKLLKTLEDKLDKNNTDFLDFLD